MSMTWSEIIDVYTAITENQPEAERERFLHINEGKRFVSNQPLVTMPELNVPNATVTTTIGQDWVEHDCSAYAIRYIVNQDTGTKLEPERDGMRGRARLLESGSDKPASGAVHHYARDGNRIWLRDTPDSVVTLTIAFKTQAPEVTAANLDEHPITPEQYDYAIALAAASSYFKAHPPLLPPDMIPDLNRYKAYEQMAIDQIQGQEDPHGMEQRDKRYYFQALGYEFGVSGR